ncbi:MAG: hypothetical protein AAFW83_09005 [Pseudomonadota bacterium]
MLSKKFYTFADLQPNPDVQFVRIDEAFNEEVPYHCYVLAVDEKTQKALLENPIPESYSQQQKLLAYLERGAYLQSQRYENGLWRPAITRSERLDSELSHAMHYEHGKYMGMVDLTDPTLEEFVTFYDLDAHIDECKERGIPLNLGEPMPIRG